MASYGERHHGAHSSAAALSLGVSGESFLDFSQNINPLGPPSGVLEAAGRAIQSAVTYPDSGYPDLCGALADYLGVDAGHILPTNGGAEALFLSALGLARSGARRALILEPTFSEYAAAARAAGLYAERRLAWCEADGEFVLDHASLDDLRDSDVVFLCNPNNPTGSVIPRDETLEIAETARSAGATLIVDEAFADFAPELSVATEAGDGLVIARSFTKFFAVPGLRLGCLVTPDAARYGAIQPSWPVNAAAEAAGISAASDEGFARRSVSRVRELRAGLRDGMCDLPGLRVYGGAANFLLVRGPAGMPERLARRSQKPVLVRGCEPFEGLEKSHFRVAVREEADNQCLLSVLGHELSEAP